jgi:hypothetical protein
MLSFTHFSDEVKFESPRQEDELLNSDDESNLVHEIVVPTCSYRWVSQQIFNHEMTWQINLKIKIEDAINKIVSNNLFMFCYSNDFSKWLWNLISIWQLKKIFISHSLKIGNLELSLLQLVTLIQQQKWIVLNFKKN